MEQKNLVQVFYRLVKLLDIPVSRQSIINELEKHPDHSTLLAISDLLNNWNVPSAAYELTFDELIAAETPVPFIAYVSHNELVVVHHWDAQSVVVSNERWNKHRLSIEEFKKIYSGSVLFAEREENSGEVDYVKKHRRQLADDFRLPFVISASLIILLASLSIYTDYLTSFNAQIIFLTLFKSAGFVVSILLLLQSINANNPLIQKLCGGDSNKNCNAILSSKAAQVVDGLSWSEVGFFYFSGTWLALLFNSGHSSILQTLAILNLLSLPYTFYSIYHQWRVAKQWCILCCSVQALLWLEFFAFLPSLTHAVQLPDIKESASLGIIMAIPIIGWVFIKPFLLLNEQIQPLKDQLYRFKYNTELFEKMLNEEVKYAVPDEDSSLILGNGEAEIIITMVSNPFCQPCAKAHKILDEWLDTRDDIKLQVIFATNTSNEADKKSKVAAHLLNMKNNQNDFSLKKAMSDWYEQKQKSYDAWSKVYPLKNKTDMGPVLDIQREWCVFADIKGTPAIFINGRRLPRMYKPEDIKYFI